MRLKASLTMAGSILRPHGALRPARERTHRRELIWKLVQIANAATDALAGDLAGEAQHGRIGGVGRAQRRCGIEHARARHHGVNAGAPCGARVAERHVRRALLMPRADEAHLAGTAIHRIEEMIELPAGQSENRVDAVAQHLRQQRVRPAHRPISTALPHALLQGCLLIPKAGNQRNSLVFIGGLPHLMNGVRGIGGLILTRRTRSPKEPPAMKMVEARVIVTCPGSQLRDAQDRHGRRPARHRRCHAQRAGARGRRVPHRARHPLPHGPRRRIRSRTSGNTCIAALTGAAARSRCAPLRPSTPRCGTSRRRPPACRCISYSAAAAASGVHGVRPRQRPRHRRDRG